MEVMLGIVGVLIVFYAILHLSLKAYYNAKFEFINRLVDRAKEIKQNG